MGDQFEVIAQKREQYGKAHSRRMRHQGQIPAVVYGAGKDSVSLVLDHNHILHALELEAFYSHVLALNIDGKKETVVLKDVQRHTYKPKILHVDFLRVSAKSAITMTVPLHFLNESSAMGVKDGGVLTHNLSEVEVKCLPKNLPEYIEVDVAKLEKGQAIHLTELVLPKGVELVALSHGEEDHDLAVVSIHNPRVVTEDTETEVVESSDVDTAVEEKDKA